MFWQRSGKRETNKFNDYCSKTVNEMHALHATNDFFAENKSEITHTFNFKINVCFFL